MEFEAVRRDGGSTMEVTNVTVIEGSDLYSETCPDDERLQKLANSTEIIGVLEMTDGVIEDIGKSLGSEETVLKQVKDAYKNDKVLDAC